MDSTLRNKLFFAACAELDANVKKQTVVDLAIELQVDFSGSDNNISLDYWKKIIQQDTPAIFHAFTELNVPAPSNSRHLLNFLCKEVHHLPYHFLMYLVSSNSPLNIGTFYLETCLERRNFRNIRHDLLYFWVQYFCPLSKEVTNDLFVFVCRNNLKHLALMLYDLLEDSNVDVYCSTYGSTPLMHAAKCRHIHMVLWLLSKGADPLHQKDRLRGPFTAREYVDGCPALSLILEKAEQEEKRKQEEKKRQQYEQMRIKLEQQKNEELQRVHDQKIVTNKLHIVNKQNNQQKDIVFMIKTIMENTELSEYEKVTALTNLSF